MYVPDFAVVFQENKVVLPVVRDVDDAEINTWYNLCLGCGVYVSEDICSNLHSDYVYKYSCPRGELGMR